VDASRSLDVYDHVLRHLAEIKSNSRFRRDEVRALAGSVDPVLRLGRASEARRRLDAAFSRLSELKVYPAEKVELGSEADDAVRALADYEAGNGNLSRAIEIDRRLLDQIMAAGPKPESNLRDAADLSRLFASLVTFSRRAGNADSANSLDARRGALWRLWARKLPGNPFVLRQLAAI
jgi:hypothetical protein